jgi:hypothetical protein
MVRIIAPLMEISKKSIVRNILTSSLVKDGKIMAHWVGKVAGKDLAAAIELNLK